MNNDVLSPWQGKKCDGFDRLDHAWRIRFGEKNCLIVECPWRVLDSEGIYLASSDDGQKFGREKERDAEAEARSLLLGKRVRGLKIWDRTSDLHVEFDEGLTLELFNGSSGYEAWQADCFDGIERKTIIAQGGGQLVIFGQPRH